jgi:E3 SUMO-protein ligase PIAS1
VEDVIVEANGEWHTSDNKYGSSTWKATHPVASVSTLATPRSSSSAVQAFTTSIPKPINGHTNGKAKAKGNEIFVLDSDDEDEGQVKRELSPSFGSASSTTQSFHTSTASVRQTQSQASDIIDLTLDSDEEDFPLSKQPGKRKATDADVSSTSPTEQIWKKSRLETDRSVPPGLMRGSSNNPNTLALDYHASHPTPSRSTPHSSPLQYSPPYPGATPAPNYPMYGGSPTGSSPGTTLPGINSMLPRSRWS